MPKKYLDKNVYEAAIERLEIIFREFPRVYFSFSAGKDSSVMVHLALEVAKRLNKLPIHVLLIDLEGQYKTTIDHATEILTLKEVVPYWVCLPMNLRNGVSQYQSQWMCWDPNEKENWIRPMPEHPGVISDENYFPFFRRGEEFEQFVVEFGEWFSHGEKTACCVAIRSDESLNRFRTIASKSKVKFRGFGWSTKLTENLYNVYPIYDWKTEDDWIAVGKFGWSYNKLYDLMYLQGRSINDMRICQPYGDDQKKGLDLFHACEPETWFKVVNRVSGANMGSIYRCDKILGHGGVILPKGQTWKKYAILLLESMPRYEAEHYMKKIRVFLVWWGKHGFPVIPDESDPKLEAQKKAPSWRRIVKTLMKNDRLCKSLSFSQTKFQRAEWEDLRKKYGDEDDGIDGDTDGNEGNEGNDGN
jgi:predicted phosphoadenosine phosphosulfate sulfurtransferase